MRANHAYVCVCLCRTSRQPGAAEECLKDLMSTARLKSKGYLCREVCVYVCLFLIDVVLDG